jgi:type III secretion protein C
MTLRRSYFSVAVLFYFPFVCAASGDDFKLQPGPYRYLVIDQDIKDVLLEFGRNLNVPVKISSDVGGRRVKGNPPASEAKEFLGYLCNSYGLVWYFDGTVLHIVTDKDMDTDVIPLKLVKQDEVMSRLKTTGVLDPRFNVRLGPSPDVITVYGPPKYRSRVKEVLFALEDGLKPKTAREVKMGDEIQVKVFRGGS